MAEKVLNTRIQLKYDTLTNWNASTFKLKAGELAVVTVGEMKDGSTHSNAQYPVLFKVGTGNHTFSELPFASALAADVYAWAKKSGIEIEDNSNGGKFIAGITWSNDKLVVTRTNVDWSDIQNKEMASSTVDGLMSAADKAKLDGMNLETGAGIKAAVASSLDEDGIEQVKGIKVNEAAGADVAVRVAHKLIIDDETQYDGSAEVTITEKIKSLATSAVEALIKASDDTNLDVSIENINTLVDYVNKNAGDIAGLVTSVNDANTNANNAVTTANNANTTAGEALAAANEASQTAGTAADDAAEALEAANGANTTAGEAKELATTANTNASNAVTTAGEAKTTADAAAAAVTAETGRATEVENGLNTRLQIVEAAIGESGSVADDIATAKQEAIDTAAADATAKANQALADAIVKVNEALEAAKTDSSNKDAVVLAEAQTAATTAETNAKAYAESLANNYATAEQGAKADSAVQSIVVAENEGLKVTRDESSNVVTIGFDPDIVFVFDCGNASNHINQ